MSFHIAAFQDKTYMFTQTNVTLAANDHLGFTIPAMCINQVEVFILAHDVATSLMVTFFEVNGTKVQNPLHV